MIREGLYVKLRVLRLEPAGLDKVRVIAKHDLADTTVVFTLPRTVVEGVEDVERLRKLVLTQPVQCLIHRNWTVRKGGLCKRWYRCLERGSARCIARGPA